MHSPETDVTRRLVTKDIETDIPEGFLGNLMDFVYQRYVRPQRGGLADISGGSVDGYPVLTFTILDAERRRSLMVRLRGSEPVRLEIIMLGEKFSQEKVDLVRQDISILVDLFEEKIRESTLYFAWREGADIVPERVRDRGRSSLTHILQETQVLLFVFFIVLSILVFQLIGSLTPLVLLGVELVFVLYSNKLVARFGDWKITESNPSIHFLEYHVPFEEQIVFRRRFTSDRLMELKREVYEKTILTKGQIDCDTVRPIFNRFGLECRPENLTAKEVDVHDLVKRTADKFGFPMPEVVVSNTTMPNAAASGPGPSHGVVLITTGLLVQLSEDEILSVLGHEFGHLRGHDPLNLYALSAVQYLLLSYVFYSPISISLTFFFLYFWGMTLLQYFIAKFFEYRADLVSAMVIGQPNVFAEALEKIGFKRLILERASLNRIREWLSFDPHPPIYFRINRLEKIKAPVKIEHPLLRSVIDVIHGFISSL